MDQNTHILVEKNGIQDEMNTSVWESIGGDSNKDGWKRVPTAPIEVLEMKRKSIEEPIEEPVLVKSKLDPAGEPTVKKVIKK